MSQKDDDPAERLLALIRSAHLKEKDAELRESFVDDAFNAIAPAALAPADRLERLMRWAHVHPPESPPTAGAEERFAADVMRRIRTSAESTERELPFIEWVEFYASRSLRVAAPLAAALVVWVIVIGLRPSIPLNDLIRAGF